MKCSVGRSMLEGSIRCPANKSYTHRAVFMGSLSGDSTIINPLYSSDTRATILSCTKFGASISEKPGSLHIGSPITLDAPHNIDAANSGTTIRMAAGIAALSWHTTTLTGDSSLQRRPMEPMLAALRSMGATCTSSNGTPPISVTGPIRGGNACISGKVSSQFVSSLLMCAPLTDNGMRLSIQGTLVSKPYLDATIRVMAHFGVHVNEISPYSEYDVHPQQYRGATFEVPPDHSSMALLLAASVLVGKNVIIEAPHSSLPQADAVFTSMLQEMGADISVNGDRISASCTKTLKGGTFDLSDTPDLLPPLAILGLRSQKPLHITNAGHVRYKETDRISIMCDQLRRLGASVRENPDGMVVSAQELHGAHLDPHGDHRIFMALCIAGMLAGDCTVGDAESVSVSYPGFVEEMRLLGAQIMT